MTRTRASEELPRFLAIGAIGFVVDGGLLMALTGAAGLPVIGARLASFAVAVTVTWLLNRVYTFRHCASRRRLAEWRRYVAVNSVGAAINLGIFSALVLRFPWFEATPLAAFAVASAVALAFNFLGSRMFAFRLDGAPAPGQDAAPPPFR